MNGCVTTNLVDLFLLNLLSSFHWNIWLEQSSQIWKDLFLLNLRNSTIPKVFLSEIVNFPSFHIQTFHISCNPPISPALSDTLFTLNHAATETAKMVVQVKHFICKTYFAMFSIFAEKWNKDFIMWRVFYKLFSIGSKMGHFYLIFKMNIFFVLKEKGRNLWTKINKT